ncbi:unknown [Firmicutes bacterium CAG:582]|nr:unknown [Firmicutes bacterium CAG:582]
MKNTKEIILFYEKVPDFNLTDIAKEILDRYEYLGEPTIIPRNENNTFLVVFNKNSEFQIEINDKNVLIVMKHSYFNDLNSIVFDVVDTFEMFDTKFSRIGYISSNFESPLKIEKAKEKYLNVEEFKDVLELNLSWYRKINFRSSYINCWERVITDTVNFKDLLLQYDINTLVGEKVDIDMKFIKDFFKTSDDYIEKRIDF